MRYMYEIIMLSQKNPNTKWKEVRNNSILNNSFKNIKLNICFSMLSSFAFARALVQERIQRRKLMRCESCGLNILQLNVYNQV